MKTSTIKHEHSCATCNSRLHSVFSVVEAEHVHELNEHKACNVYKKGQVIFSQNGLPLGLFCVNSGKIKLSVSGTDGKEQILRLVKGGDILGYRALISNDRYHCSAIALEDSSVCIVDKAYFLKLALEDQKLCRAIFKKISDDLKKAEEHIVSLSQKNVRERMAEALLFFKATYGYDSDEQTLAVQLSREEIADFVGTSTESAIRLLSEFNNDKIIELVGKKIKIINPDKLTKTANLLY
jgi:CRP/FNR family transcriptional regulator, polysaccharide utilization system transcription regulator